MEQAEQQAMFLGMQQQKGPNASCHCSHESLVPRWLHQYIAYRGKQALYFTSVIYHSHLLLFQQTIVRIWDCIFM